ncbi:tripartite tricarboxylate transporter permease [Solwaraspora sp. WMMD937]|uniref:tripartite tricarboxylate transporter permease n=1 Tax=Solwaraspora sp. WMMD937 TaxID=3016090 RepID=UPI002499F7C5|nr:tripartite tricarboxylate transporter permease [Solwaraspora sp. WMMD937]WFE19963.1 tripartite tricarboxylate transporter permease [Solwaraspora sp. WMMD937]
MIDDLGQMLAGLTTALLPIYLLYALAGAALGTIVGVLPGLGPTMTMAMLLPVAFSLGDPLGAIILFGGVFYGSMYAGSITSILLGLPGESSGIVSVFDGHQMTLRGRAGAALLSNGVGSFVGGLLATTAIVFVARPIVDVAVQLSPADYFALIAFALATTTLMGDRLWPGLFALTVGLALGTIGTHSISGDERFVFGIAELRSGIDLSLVAIGLYAVSVVVLNLANLGAGPAKPAVIGKLYMTRQEWRRSVPPYLRGSVLGFVVGVLPGLGGTVATFLSYNLERRLAKHPEEFGRGSIEGLAGPSAADNAGSGGSFVPLLTLGIPGSAATALMLGALQGFGVQTGPLMLQNNPELVWGVIGGLLVANAMLLVLNVPLVGIWVKLLEIPGAILYPLIIVISTVGAYSIGRTPVLLFVVLGLGVIGLTFRLLGIPLAPAVMGIVLGPLLEQEWARTLVISRGSYEGFVSTPLSVVMLSLAVLVLLLPLAQWPIQLLRRRHARTVTAPTAPGGGS